jgi:hypothetical protein
MPEEMPRREEKLRRPPDKSSTRNATHSFVAKFNQIRRFWGIRSIISRRSTSSEKSENWLCFFRERLRRTNLVRCKSPFNRRLNTSGSQIKRSDQLHWFCDSVHLLTSKLVQSRIIIERFGSQTKLFAEIWIHMKLGMINNVKRRDFVKFEWHSSM